MFSIRAKKAAQREQTMDAAGSDAKPSPARQGPATTSAREAEIDAIARDLLRDVVEPDRPAVYALALRTARAIRRTI